MEITVNWYAISIGVTLLLTWSGFLVGVIKWLIGRMIANLDKRLETNNDQCNQKWMQVEARCMQTDADLKQLMIKLPVEYQRREDAIRENTVINAKLDRIYELIAEKKQQ